MLSTLCLQISTVTESEIRLCYLIILIHMLTATIRLLQVVLTVIVNTFSYSLPATFLTFLFYIILFFFRKLFYLFSLFLLHT